MNSSLQCLLATKNVADFFKTNKYKQYLKNDEEDLDFGLTIKFAKLVKEVKSKKKEKIEPWAFKIQFSNFYYMVIFFNVFF